MDGGGETSHERGARRHLKAATKDLTKIWVEGLEVYAYHGVSEAEKSLGHRLRLDLFATIEESARDTDKISETVDYAVLASRAAELCTQTKRHTLEWICEQMGTTLMSEHLLIQELTLKIAKLNPALPLQIGAVGVERTFTRNVQD